MALARPLACRCRRASAQAGHPPRRRAFTKKGAWSSVWPLRSCIAKAIHPSSHGTRKLAAGYFMVRTSSNLTTARDDGSARVARCCSTNKLQPVWFNPSGNQAHSGKLREQSYLGKPVLTYWPGFFLFFLIFKVRGDHERTVHRGRPAITEARRDKGQGRAGCSRARIRIADGDGLGHR